jgi:hypothetical protein
MEGDTVIAEVAGEVWRMACSCLRVGVFGTTELWTTDKVDGPTMGSGMMNGPGNE